MLVEWLDRRIELVKAGLAYLPKTHPQVEIEYRKNELEPLDAIRRLIEEWGKWPTIVCLCGSTRFMDAFFDAGWAETLAGKIVLSVGVCKHAKDHGGEALGPEVVRLLDELHLRKIDLADEVLVLNVGGYIGESTRNELEYAREKGKRIRFLEPVKESPDDQTK